MINQSSRTSRKSNRYSSSRSNSRTEFPSPSGMDPAHRPNQHPHEYGSPYPPHAPLDHNQGRYQQPFNSIPYDVRRISSNVENPRTRHIHPPPPSMNTQNTIHHILHRNIPIPNPQTELDAEIPFQRLPPPPPADNLPFVIGAGPGTGGGSGGGKMTLSGFQTDYSRVNMLDDRLRRAPNSDEIRSTVQLKRKEGIRPVQAGEEGSGKQKEEEEEGETNLPVPAEAYIIMRHHRLPNKVWNDGIAREMREADDWTFELHLVQQPIRGKALGLVPLPRGWPALSAPLIVQLTVKDQKDKILPVDHPVLNRKLVHTSMAVDLVSEDGTESRSFMRTRPSSNDSNEQFSPIATSQNQPNPQLFSGSQRNLLGSLHRSANTYTLDGKRGIYFLFTELVVRNVGRFALRVSLFDLAGPTHLGTSIGITQTICTALTQPFTVYHATEFPGALPVTDLSMEFTRQGERNLGRRTRADISSEDDLVNMNENTELSPEIQIPPRSITHNNHHHHHHHHHSQPIGHTPN